jgi:inner membrane protein YidH
VVARFGLFLREVEFTQHQISLHSGRFTLWVGTGLILIGVVVNLFSALQHIRFVRAVKTGTDVVDRPVTMAVVIALILAVTGVAMTIYLVFVR